MEATIDANTEAVTNVCHDGHISDTVIDAVATATGNNPLELEPLYTVVDPDALDALFRPSIGSPEATLKLQFSMAGCQVTVHADGEVAVIPPSTNEAAQTTDAPRKA